MLLPWAHYLYLQKDFPLIYYSLKALVPVSLGAVGFMWLASHIVRRRKIDLPRYQVWPIAFFGGFLTIGVLNGSFFENPMQYGRFIWPLAIGGIAYVFLRVELRAGTRLFARPSSITLAAIGAGFLLSALVYQSYLGQLASSGAELWAYVNSRDKADLVRVPTVAVALIVVLAAAIFNTTRRYGITVLLLVIGGFVVYYGMSRTLAITALLTFALLVGLGRQVSAGRLGLVVIVLAFYSFVKIASIGLAEDVEFLASTSWYARLRSVLYVVESFRHASFPEALFGFGMVSSSLVRPEPEYFWPGDIWLIGMVYEFGLVGIAIYWVLLIQLLRWCLAVASSCGSMGFMRTPLFQFEVVFSLTVIVDAIFNPFYYKPIIFSVVAALIIVRRELICRAGETCES